MDRSVEVLIWMAALALTALVAFAAYRWRQRGRVRQVQTWVEDYVSARCDGPAHHLDINCSDDPLWPVLVAFDDPRTGTRHSLRFACSGRPTTFTLLSEKEEARPMGALR